MPRYRKSAVELARSIPHRNLVGVEIGVQRGDLSVQLLKGCNWTLLYLVDPWATYADCHPYYKSGDTVARLSMREQQDNYQTTLSVTAFAGEKVKVVRDFSYNAVKQIPGEVDFVFLDANHVYEFVKRDLELWWPKISVAGIIAGHDYGSPRDKRGIWGITKATHEFFGPKGLEISLKSGKVWWLQKPAKERATEKEDGFPDNPSFRP
jgi:hypothetical protein